MNNFPSEFTPTNYSYMTRVYHMSLIRQKIHEHIMLRQSESDFFYFWEYCRNALNITKDISGEYLKVIVSELESLGWVCGTTASDSCLFIYINKDSPPHNFYQESL
jgi:hypothetical protein